MPNCPQFPPRCRPGALAPMLLAAAMLLAAGTATAIDLIPDFLKGEPKGRVVFEGRDQYIRIEPQDELRKGPPPPNDHPVDLDAGQLSTVLEAITLWKEAGLFDGGDEQLGLFTGSQASFLARNLAKGLAEAGPDEDVTFAVVGLVQSFVVAKDKRSTAGRVFYRDGRLNIIIGDMHRTYTYGKELDPTGVEQGVDRRIYPHRTGRRAKPRSMPARMMTLEGMSLQEIDGETRSDWLVIDLPVALAAAKKEALPDGVAEETQKLREEAAKLAVERRQMREEMARLRKQVDEMDAGAPASTESLESRLSKLDALRSKQLITEEEYRAKRTEILNEI